MNEVISIIEKRKDQLENTDFVNWLGASSLEDKELFSFAPAMTFFVLGFRDILETAKIKVPKTTLDHMINIHCEEDSEHWLWFIKDLETLGHDTNSWGGNSSEILIKIWSDELRPIREMVYLSISKIMEAKNPKINLVLIEVLEAAFESFIKNIKGRLEGKELYKELIYFGEKHVSEECSHSLGSWDDMESVEEGLHGISLNSEEITYSKELINELFDQFERIFSCWFIAKDTFRQTRVASLPKRQPTM